MNIILLDSVWNYINIKRKKVKTGDNLTIHGRLHIHGWKGRISIGDNCIITSSEDANPTAGGHATHLVAGKDGSLTIGNNVGMSFAYIVAYSSVTIEDNVLIGADVKIWDNDFHPVEYNQRIRNEKPEPKPIHIGEGAFIGACSIILKGVTIGKRSVIGAGSVVTKDIPDDEVWAGNPVVFIRKINEDR